MGNRSCLTRVIIVAHRVHKWVSLMIPPILIAPPPRLPRPTLYLPV